MWSNASASAAWETFTARRRPGWGDLLWRRIISELQLAGYRGALAVEHEDPTMSPREGLVQAVRHLAPLILREPPPTERWW